MNSRWVRLSAVLAMPLAALVWASLGPQRASTAPPVGAYARTATVTHDLGPVSQGGRILFTAEVRNATETAVTLSDVRADCGCTGVLDGLEGRVIPPGGVVAVAATYSADGSGPFDRSIHVNFSDGRSERHRFKGTIVSQVDTVPSRIQSGAEGVESSVVLSSRWGGRPKIESARLHPPGDYEIRIDDFDGDAVGVHVAPSSVGAGEYAGTLFVRLSAPEERTVMVPVRIGLPEEPTLAAIAE